MNSFKNFFLLILLSLHTIIVFGGELTTKLELVKESSIRTAYFNIKTKEFKLPKDIWGWGGAILPLNGEIIYGSTSGEFYKINIYSLIYEKNYLPKLESGVEFFSSSKKINYKEISPRVLDIAFVNDIFYVTHERYDPLDDSLKFVISKIKKTDKEWTDLYVSPKLDVSYFAAGDGGKMAIKGNKLYFTVGDFNLDRINGLPSDVAPQKKNLPWGKINYINLQDGSFHYYSMGHRNPKGLLFLNSGQLLSSENGPQGGDEINLIKMGKNYGWPYESFGTVYGESFARYKDSIPLPGKDYKSRVKLFFINKLISVGNLFRKINGDLLFPDHGVYELPIFSFVPSIAPSAIIQIQNFDLNWDGDLLLGSLKALSLFHLKLNGDRVIYSEPIFLGKRIRDLRQLDKKLILLTDSNSIILVEKN
jgi:hypothetical protein